MNPRMSIGGALVIASLAVAGSGMFAASPAPYAPGAGAIAVRDGTVTFDVATNVPALGVHGKSSSLEGRAEVRRGEGTLVIEGLQARLPVQSLGTGLGLRDTHMKKYIFTTSDGQTPDVTFVAPRVECADLAGGRSASCPVTGDLTIRGVSKPWSLALKVSPDGGSYRAVGDGTVELSAFGIERPSQFGVSTADAVTVHLEIVARTVPPAGTAGAGGGR